MNKIERTLKFYLLATTLKDIIRTGWMNWHVSKERLESVAEHVYGTCILAIVIESEFETNIDLNKTIKMLVLHELEEALIGDITPYDNVNENDKLLMGRSAVNKILSGMIREEEYTLLLDEFNEHKTKEAKFAFMCDKLEADIQSKIYVENSFCNIYSPENKNILESEQNDSIRENKYQTLADLFINYSLDKFDDSFKSIAVYVKENNILDLIKE